MSRPLPFRRVAAISVVLVLAAACSGDGDGPDDDGPTTVTSADEAEREALPTSLTEMVGPVPSLDPGAAQQWYFDRAAEREAAMAGCMGEAGFEYVPVDPAALAATPWVAGIDWATPEWVHTYGFGVSTLRFPQSAVGPDLVGYVDQADAAATDPNEVYVEGLAADEREQWDAALTDCDGATWDSSRSANLAAAFNERFSAELTEMYDALRADARYGAIHTEVQTCARAAGVAYVDHETTLNELESRLLPLDERQLADGALSPEALATLGQIQADEIAIATAVDDCGGRFLADNPAHQELVAEYESAFIVEHEEALRDFLAID